MANETIAIHSKKKLRYEKKNKLGFKTEHKKAFESSLKKRKFFRDTRCLPPIDF